MNQPRQRRPDINLDLSIIALARKFHAHHLASPDPSPGNRHYGPRAYITYDGRPLAAYHPDRVSPKAIADTIIYLGHGDRPIIGRIKYPPGHVFEYWVMNGIQVAENSRISGEMIPPNDPAIARCKRLIDYSHKHGIIAINPKAGEVMKFLALIGFTLRNAPTFLPAGDPRNMYEAADFTPTRQIVYLDAWLWGGGGLQAMIDTPLDIMDALTHLPLRGYFITNDYALLAFNPGSVNIPILHNAAQMMRASFDRDNSDPRPLSVVIFEGEKCIFDSREQAFNETPFYPSKDRLTALSLTSDSKALLAEYTLLLHASLANTNPYRSAFLNLPPVEGAGDIASIGFAPEISPVYSQARCSN